MPDRYRTDLTLRTIYRDDKRIGVIDNPQDAAHIVKVLNTVQKLAEATDHHVLDDAVMCLVLEVKRRDTRSEDNNSLDTTTSASVAGYRPPVF